MVQLATGANYPAVSDGIVKSSEIPLPSLDEQKRIAAILDKANDIRKKQQEAFKLSNTFLRSTFIDMFGDPGINPKGWKKIDIGYAIEKEIIEEVQDGNHGEIHPKVSDFETCGFPFLTANCLKNGYINFEGCYYLNATWLKKLRVGFAKPNDVILTHKGTLGLTAILNSKYETYICSPQTTYYRVNYKHLIPEFLNAYFVTNYFQHQLAKAGKQSTRLYVGLTRQKALPLIVPSIDIQYEYLKIIDKCNLITEMNKGELYSKKILLNSLYQRAFRGDL